MLFGRPDIAQLRIDVDELTARVDMQAGFLEAKDVELRKARSDAHTASREIARLERENDGFRNRVADLEHELRLARRHLDNCPTALAVADHDSDKARSNQ